MRRVLAALLAVGPALVAAGSAAAQEVKVPADAKPVLSKASAWRWHVAWRRPDVLPADPKASGGAAPQAEVLKPLRSFDEESDTELIEYPPPAAGWAGAEFDDGDWPRERLPVWPGGGHMGPFHVTAGLLSVRAQFTVDDPKAVTGLYLSLVYRGGAVVRLNGREVARCSLPEGAITPATPGHPYPDEAWVDAEGKPLPRPAEKMAPELKERLAKRDRQFGPVPLPADALRKGLNVLAIEVHRSDFHPSAKTWWGLKVNGNLEYMYGYFRGWVPIGLNDAQLLATGSGFTANVERPAGVQVWVPDAADRLEALDYPDPCSGPPALVIRAVRNGQFSGALAVSGTEALKGLKVIVGDLARQGGGGMIPASAVRVRHVLKANLPETAARYGASKVFDVMAEAPPAEVVPDARSKGAAALAWLTVQVPKDAAAGDYQGKVSVALEGRAPVEIPLKLGVAGWTLPDPQSFRTVVDIYQSPRRWRTSTRWRSGRGSTGS